MTWDMTLEELAEKQYKELQNGRLAMLAFAGTAAPWHPWWHPGSTREAPVAP